MMVLDPICVHYSVTIEIEQKVLCFITIKMVLPTLHSHFATKRLATPQQIIQRKQDIDAEKK